MNEKILFSSDEEWKLKDSKITKGNLVVIYLLSFLSQIIFSFAELFHRTGRLDCSQITSVHGFTFLKYLILTFSTEIIF